MTESELSVLTIRQLRRLSTLAGVNNGHRMRKSDLVAALAKQPISRSSSDHSLRIIVEDGRPTGATPGTVLRFNQ